MGYIVTLVGAQMVITNGSVSPVVRIALPRPVVELSGDYIVIHDNSGAFNRRFRLKDFDLVTGVEPTSILDAYTRLLAVQTSISSTGSGGGGGGGGDASAALQTVGNNSLDSIDIKTPSLVSGKVPVDGSGVVQPVSASALPLPAGASTSALQTSGNSSVASIDSKTPTLVNGKIPVDGSGAIQPVTATTLPLPAGASTSDLQVAGNASSASIDSKTPTLVGGKIPVDGSGVTQPISASVLPLPTGASTSANQATANSSLSSIDGKVPALASGRIPVVLPTGFSTDTLQSTGNTSLAAINTKTPPLGSATIATSTPVNIAQDQLSDTFITGLAGQTALNTNILSPTGGPDPIDCLAFRSFGIQVIPTGTITAGTVTFETSNDPNFGGISTLWAQDFNTLQADPLSTVNPSTGARSVSGPLPFRYFRARIPTAITGGGSIQGLLILRQMTYQGHILTVRQGTASNLNAAINILTPGNGAANLGKAEDAAHTTGDTGVMPLYVRQDTPVQGTSANGDYSFQAGDMFGNGLVRSYQTIRKTYSASFNVTLDASATDIVEIIGSGSSSIQITQIFISGVATASSVVNLALIRKSSLATGGSSSTIAATNHETGDAATTATVKTYSANPTVGTTVGRLRLFPIPLGTSSLYGSPLQLDFGINGKPIILSGATQTLCISNAGSVPSGTILTVSIEYAEV